MKFTQLKLTGFKSFVDPTELRIEPGLTAVIGPNGCGKSNLLEALRWVMGATSPKSLRGEGMEDVIFSGTGMRPARDRAEVVLTIDNSERLAPARFNGDPVLEVSRRIARGAGSSYRVNGEEVRAKDVQLLFADAGTGANSPALVRQGQISELIAAKPENRRRILEEAAGVSGLRARRHESELRLKAAESNLDRLQELIDDLEARRDALQRQARQAMRYRKLSTELKAFEAALWLRRWRDAVAAESAAAQELAAAEAAVAEAAKLSAAAAAAAERASAACDPARAAEAEASAALRRLERERDNLQRDAAEAARAVEALETRLKDLAAAAAREAEIRDDAASRREAAGAEAEALNAVETGEAVALVEAEAVLETAETRRAEAETALDAAARTAADAQAALETARRERAAAEARLQKIARDAEAARRALADLDADAVPDLDLEGAAARAAREQADAVRAALDAAEARRREAEEGERAAADSLRDAEAEIAALAREAATLERLLAEDAGENRALDAVRAKPGYEKALAAALGDDLEASLDAAAARRWAGTTARAEALPSGAQSLSDFIAAPSVLAARLAAVGIAPADKAAQMATLLKPGQRLVTREGDLWRWDGYGARADAPSAAAARLAQRNRLDEIAAERATLAPARDMAAAAALAARETLDRAREKERAAREAVAPAEQAARDAEARHARVREAAARDAERRSALEAGIARLEAERAETGAALQQADKALQTLSADDGAKIALTQAREAADAARRDSAEARAALDSLRREAAIRRQRLEALAREAADWTRRAEAAAGRITMLAGESETALAQLEAARGRPAETEAALSKLADLLARAESETHDARERAFSADQSAKAADGAARAAEREAGTTREARAAAEARLNAARERVGETAERLQTACGCGPEALDQSENEFAALSQEALEGRIDQARQARERLGEVNLRADAEAEELEARREELTRERDDLIAAIDRLRKAVDALSREGRARLLEAFERVQANFRELFETLFEGGQAELRLTESDDPLEAGLEIYACPPGKKLEVMSLLSGGEQALTASALIFAVFLSNPAPVCVLDEVDAPLDDANVDRFCRMLDAMRRKTETRFLVITHNPLTMSRMDRLYGVTMAERGVSQLVSMDLAGAERLIAAE